MAKKNEPVSVTERLYDDLEADKQRLAEFSEENGKVLETYQRLLAAVSESTELLKEALKSSTEFPAGIKTVKWRGWEIQRQQRSVEFPKELMLKFLNEFRDAGLLAPPKLKDVTAAVGKGLLTTEVLKGYTAPDPEYILKVAVPK